MKKKRGFPKLVGHDPPIVAIAFEWKIACWALLFLKQSISSGTPSSNPFVLLLLLLLLLLWLFSQHFPTFRFATRLLCWPKAPLTKRPEKENKMERNLPTHPRQKKTICLVPLHRVHRGQYRPFLSGRSTNRLERTPASRVRCLRGFSANAFREMRFSRNAELASRFRVQKKKWNGSDFGAMNPVPISPLKTR